MWDIAAAATFRLGNRIIDRTGTQWRSLDPASSAPRIATPRAGLCEAGARAVQVAASGDWHE